VSLIVQITPLADLSRLSLDLFSIHFIITKHSSIAAMSTSQYEKKLKLKKIRSILVMSCIFMSRIFMPCKMVRHFHVRHFHAWQTHAYVCVLICGSRVISLISYYLFSCLLTVVGATRSQNWAFEDKERNEKSLRIRARTRSNILAICSFICLLTYWFNFLLTY